MFCTHTIIPAIPISLNITLISDIIMHQHRKFLKVLGGHKYHRAFCMHETFTTPTFHSNQTRTSSKSSRTYLFITFVCDYSVRPMPMLTGSIFGLGGGVGERWPRWPTWPQFLHPCDVLLDCLEAGRKWVDHSLVIVCMYSNFMPVPSPILEYLLLHSLAYVNT